jgi:copper homeostasis protein
VSPVISAIAEYRIGSGRNVGNFPPRRSFAAEGKNSFRVYCDFGFSPDAEPAQDRPMTIEICVDNLASVEACARAESDRIELCSGLVEGGTTPSIGFLHAARQAFPGKIMAMLRPRGGDFVYSAGEFELMLNEIDFLRAQGADGIVFGMLHPDGTIDVERSRQIVKRAEGLDLTFHRAFDASRDLSESLETLIGLGIPRVLTSGGAPDVGQGIEVIAELVRQAAGRLSVLPGGGIEAADVEGVARQTGVSEVHLSARVPEDSPMVHRRPDIPMGAESVPGEYVRLNASEAEVRLAKAGIAAAIVHSRSKGGLSALGRVARGIFKGKQKSQCP